MYYIRMYVHDTRNIHYMYIYVHRSTGSSGYRELYTFSCVRVYMCAMCPPPLPQALDKMEAEWDPVNMEIVPYKETGTYIMKSGEETAQMLDDHIVMAQAMSFSPYKKPFELRITTWENKLRLTQVWPCAHVHASIQSMDMLLCSVQGHNTYVHT